MLNPLSLLILFAATTATGCGYIGIDALPPMDGGSSTDTLLDEPGSATGSPIETDTRIDPDTESPSNSGSDIDGDTGSAGDTGRVTDSEGATLRDTGTNVPRPTETSKDTATGRETDSGTVPRDDTETAGTARAPTDTETGGGTDAETETPTPTGIPTETDTATATVTATATTTDTATASVTATATATASASETETVTETETETATATESESATETATGSDSEIASGTLLHRWSFNNGDLSDSVGGSAATVINPGGGGDVTFDSEKVTLAGGARDSADYIRLGSHLLRNIDASVTLELWGTQRSVQYWAHIFDAGADDANYLMMSWNVNDVVDGHRLDWRISDAWSTADDWASPYTVGQEFHIVLTIDQSASPTVLTWYNSPASSADLGASKGNMTSDNTLGDLDDVDDWLGRSHWSGDDTANASYNEVRIWYGVLTAQDLELSHDLGPNGVP